MKMVIAADVAFVLTFEPCDGSSSDKWADRAKIAADDRAEAFEASAAALRNEGAMLDQRANTTRDVGELHAKVNEPPT